ncbi:MAG: excinuclease ABC subunit UvrA [Candidatus Omnitrophica bacterium]|nr:excinuclease ABC subunit UvrA [Candidatus Omnitrophota bacterium]
MENKYIIIKGAREHNLKSIDLKLPRNQLIVITGLSGSGKSSLAFDTIYAQGQMKYVESLSAYARQFLEQMQKPDVDHIEGLSPSISIQQRMPGVNPRSTVGTVTEIYDYLRLLFSKIGEAYCYKCSRPISRQSPQQVIESANRYPSGTPVNILAPLVRGKKGRHKELLLKYRKQGFIRFRIDGHIFGPDSKIDLDKNIKHTIDIVIDRLSVKDENKKRLADSIETALGIGDGMVIITSPAQPEGILYSCKNACVKCGISYQDFEPRHFSFNSPFGACPACDGLGHKLEIDPDLVVKDPSRSIKAGAIEPWRKGGKSLFLYYNRLLVNLAGDHGFSPDAPFAKLGKKARELIFYGTKSEKYSQGYFEGVIPNLERRFRETDSDYMRDFIHGYMSIQPCPGCGGMRLKKESLSVKISGKNIAQVCKLSAAQAVNFFDGLDMDEEKKKISALILKEVRARLMFLCDVGLNYITLDRVSSTLSGGEAQRIRLATQIGSGLTGVLYVLDEPSIGLHQRDNEKLLATLKSLRDMGNTVIVVEHDEAIMRSADHIVDLGPGAGKDGGKLIYSGNVQGLLDDKSSLTALYLNGDMSVSDRRQRRDYKRCKKLVIKGASEHNLKNIDVDIPLGLFNCVTGVSGSGKSTLINEILYKALARKFYRATDRPGRHNSIIGIENIDKVIVIDQSPIGRTPRSNPATYTGVFTHIRDLFSKLPESRIRGYKPGRFSFNVKGGRCQACEGDGVKKIEMHFLPDIYVQCQVCGGKRFNQQTLEVKYKGKSITDVLQMPLSEALRLFGNIPSIRDKISTLEDVGLGYIELGQQATTLSGGEAQRVKLASELCKKATGRTLYILDEPTTGLHFADISKLLSVLHDLVDNGNTVLVIEHNLDVINSADYIMDLGPEGGDAGGRVIACGSPEEIAKIKASYTGHYISLSSRGA